MYVGVLYTYVTRRLLLYFYFGFCKNTIICFLIPSKSGPTKAFNLSLLNQHYTCTCARQKSYLKKIRLRFIFSSVHSLSCYISSFTFFDNSTLLEHVFNAASLRVWFQLLKEVFYENYKREIDHN